MSGSTFALAGGVTSVETERPTVLVADDDGDFRSALAYLLEADGYDVVEAASGNEALRTTLAESPDVVFLDHLMPGMNGAEVHAALRKAGFAGPIIFLTAIDDLARDIEDRSTYLLGKPFDADELTELMKRVFAGDNDEHP
jgi:CheY-like chemotaxis protein